jgi:hypothetical protein
VFLKLSPAKRNTSGRRRKKEEKKKNNLLTYPTFQGSYPKVLVRHGVNSADLRRVFASSALASGIRKRGWVSSTEPAVSFSLNALINPGIMKRK